MALVDDLWIVDFGDPFPGEPASHRPAVIVGPPPGFGDDFPYRIVVPLTATARGISLHVEIEPDEATGIDQVSYVQCELLRSISTQRLVHRLGTIDIETKRAITDILDVLLDR